MAGADLNGIRAWLSGASCILRVMLLLGLLGASATPGLSQQTPAPASPDEVVIEADTQERIGKMIILRGRVIIRHRGMTLHADEVTYDEESKIAEARGNVVFEREDDRVEATHATYNVEAGTGTFHAVEGTVGPPPPPRRRESLITPNPYYFKAERVEKRSDGSYMVYNGWVTNCAAGKPKWRLKAARAKIRPEQDVQLFRSRFLIRGVPIFYAPYWWISAAEEPRKSGFLMPSFGNDSRRGTSIGDAFYWAINPHADLTGGAQFFNQGGWTQSADFRALPSMQSSIRVTYFGAIAGKLARTDRRTLGIDQSGQFAQILATNRWSNGFRTVADINYLSSLRFRQRFTETFNEAVRSEVHSSVFATANPDTLYFNTFVDRYQNFLRAVPQETLTLAAAPGVELGTRPRLMSWWKNLPLYFSFDAQATGMRRDEPRFKTPELVQRVDLYPRMTLPLRLGKYFGLTPTFGVRASRYSARLIDDPSQPSGKRVLNQPIRRVTEEVSVDLKLPSLARVFDGRTTRYKHVLEPAVTYRYLNGVRDVAEILRFDERDILTDTHEVEYSLTQWVYSRPAQGEQQASEVFRWRLSQKYYFDPDLRDSIREGQRNLYTSLLSLTPFAFSDEPRRFSPLVSELRSGWKGYNTDFRFDYDSVKARIVNTRLRVATRFTQLLTASIAHYTTRNETTLQPRSNQFRLLVRYGSIFRRGFNGAMALNWNIRRDFFQSQVVQVSYNWDCCGVAFEFRRLGLGPVRSENQYRFSFTIANVGTFGTISPENRIF